jgi:hypothetical protein
MKGRPALRPEIAAAYPADVVVTAIWSDASTVCVIVSQHSRPSSAENPQAPYS